MNSSGFLNKGQIYVLLFGWNITYMVTVLLSSLAVAGLAACRLYA